ncbi:MAG: polyribonucleotide nucleotidyltransferase [Anaerolineaceae bacterium]|nr:polyribonucleotide nucleotidyltransferase [Anaerolineaceae bacterium]
MKPEVKNYRAKVGDKEIIIETGKLAGQAGGAVTVQMGDSVIFCAATMGGVREGLDFFPLTVDYEERMYAGGRIPGSFFRREGRPTSEAVLTARMTDRPIRPLFPDGMRNEVQIILMSMSADEENPLDILCINAASASLMISDIPWSGPVGAVRIGYINDELVVNPTFSEMEESKLDLVVAGTKEAIAMVEAGANEVSEQTMIEALELAHKSIQPIIEIQEQMARELGKAKREIELVSKDESLIETLKAKISGQMLEIMSKPYTKEALYGGISELKEAVIEEMTADQVESLTEAELKAQKKAIASAFEDAEKTIIRDRILAERKRPDGRGPEDIRDIWCEVDVSPRAHGSGLFTRGETQVLTLATLGTPKEAQELDNLNPTDSKRYIHHYNFPPYCVGETGRLFTNRRSIGHGMLAERALVPVLPDESEFPYTMRLVSEVMASNGSSSMASTCGSTLALMDTGVPIKRPVSGVAMGLVMKDSNYVILTDILGMEDHLGDMDFKVTGTTEGITALQMDIKISGLTTEIMAEALEQARKARLFILGKMLETIAEPRAEIKDHAPRIEIIKVPVDKIGAVIGKGGETIRSLQEETGTKIDINDDGTVYIAAIDGEGYKAARERIERLTEEVEIGRIYTGKVVRTTDFGAFVEILPGQDGLVHISQLDTNHVTKVTDVVNEGDEITVMVTNIDNQGRVRLSRQALLEGWTLEEAQAQDKANNKKSSGGNRGGNRGGGRSNNRSRR